MSEKILIVDDEKEIADLVSLYLTNENFTVFKCYSSAEALDIIKPETPSDFCTSIENLPMKMRICHFRMQSY